MKTLNAHAALLAASLMLCTTAYAQEEAPPATSSSDSLPEEAAPGSDQPREQRIVISLEITDARKTPPAPKVKPERRTKEERKLLWAERDRPMVLTLGVGARHLWPKGDLDRMDYFAPTIDFSLTSDRNYWVVNAGVGGVWSYFKLFNCCDTRGPLFYANGGLNLPVYRGAKADLRVQPTLGVRHTTGEQSGTQLFSGSFSETFTYTDMTAALGLERTHWFSNEVGITLGGAFGMVVPLASQGIHSELSLSAGVSF